MTSAELADKPEKLCCYVLTDNICTNPTVDVVPLSFMVSRVIIDKIKGNFTVLKE